MPSWSQSEVPSEEAPTPPAAPADEVEKARRLLEELFAGDEAPAEPDRPER